MIPKYFQDIEKTLNRVLVVFTAEWSRKSREQIGVISSKEFSIPIYECNVEENDASANFAIKNKIQWIPSVIIFNDGYEVSRNEGFLNYESLLNFIDSNNSDPVDSVVNPS